jgi:hypothetical protein
MEVGLHCRGCSRVAGCLMLIFEPRGVRHHRYKYRPNPPYPRLLLSSSPPHTTKKGSQRFTKRISSCLEGHISPPGPILSIFSVVRRSFLLPFCSLSLRSFRHSLAKPIDRYKQLGVVILPTISCPSRNSRYESILYIPISSHNYRSHVQAFV